MFLHDYLLACEISPRFDINLLLLLIVLENMRPVLHLSPVFPTLKYFFSEKSVWSTYLDIFHEWD